MIPKFVKTVFTNLGIIVPVCTSSQGVRSTLSCEGGLPKGGYLAKAQLVLEAAVAAGHPGSGGVPQLFPSGFRPGRPFWADYCN